MMHRMTQAQYAKLIEGSQVLTRDRHGDKVLRLADGRGVKLFRRKHFFSSNAVWPYASRFAYATGELAKRGIATVRVEQLLRVSSLQRDVVVYQYLEGQTLRDALAEGAAAFGDFSKTSGGLIANMARFVAQLHEKGVYFRGIHFANVLLLADGRWGLIDVSEARFSPGSLRLGLRTRNFKPMLRYGEDAAAIETFGFARFLDQYLDHAQLPPRSQAKLRRKVAAIDQRFATPA